MSVHFFLVRPCLELPPRHHPSPDGVLAVFAAPQQGTVLPEVAVFQRQDILVPLHCPLEDVLEIGVVRPRGLVSVVDEDVLAQVEEPLPAGRSLGWDVGRELHQVVGVSWLNIAQRLFCGPVNVTRKVWRVS